MKRGRNQRRRQGANPNRAFDSNGPDVRIRGTAQQIYDKYIALARDAGSAGDRVKGENYLQHAEHYFRMMRALNPGQAPQTEQMDDDSDGDQPGFGDSRDGYRENGHRDGNHRENGQRENGQRENGSREQQPRDFRNRDPHDRSGQDRQGQRREWTPRVPETPQDEAPAASETIVLTLTGDAPQGDAPAARDSAADEPNAEGATDSSRIRRRRPRRQPRSGDEAGAEVAAVDTDAETVGAV